MALLENLIKVTVKQVAATTSSQPRVFGLELKSNDNQSYQQNNHLNDEH